MLKRILMLGLCLMLVVFMTACGKSQPKSYVVSEPDGATMNVVVAEKAPKIDVDVSNDTFTIETNTGAVTGQLIDSEEINMYLIDHYDDMDFYECTVNGYDAFGFGGDSGSGSNAFVHVLTLNDEFGLILTASSQNALYDAEMYVSFDMGTVMTP